MEDLARSRRLASRIINRSAKGSIDDDQNFGCGVGFDCGRNAKLDSDWMRHTSCRAFLKMRTVPQAAAPFDKIDDPGVISDFKLYKDSCRAVSPTTCLIDFTAGTALKKKRTCR